MMNKIHIVNKRNRPYPIPPNTPVYSIDRSSPLGNPFFMKLEAERDKVCDQYEQYFRDTLDENVNTNFIDQLNELCWAAHKSEIALACWCAPKRCHAETIKRAIESAIRVGDKYIVPATGGVIRRKQYLARIPMDLPKPDAERLLSVFEQRTGEAANFTEYMTLDPFAMKEYAYMFYADSESAAQLLVDDLCRYVGSKVNVGSYSIKEKEAPNV